MNIKLTKPWVIQPCANGIALFPLGGSALDLKDAYFFADTLDLKTAIVSLIENDSPKEPEKTLDT